MCQAAGENKSGARIAGRGGECLAEAGFEPGQEGEQFLSVGGILGALDEGVPKRLFVI